MGDAGNKGAETAATLTVEEVQQRVLNWDKTLVEDASGEKASHLFVVTRAVLEVALTPGACGRRRPSRSL